MGIKLNCLSVYCVTLLMAIAPAGILLIRYFGANEKKQGKNFVVPVHRVKENHV